MELLHIYSEIAIADPRGAEQRRRVGVPRRQGRAKIIPDGGATGVGLLAVTSDQQIPCCRVTGGCRRPVLAPSAGGL